MTKNIRVQLKTRDLKKAMLAAWKETVKRRKEDRTPEIASSHELLGMLIEEINGVQSSIMGNSLKENKVANLNNLIVIALCALATYETNAEDW